jgi:O-antigen ligase
VTVLLDRTAWVLTAASLGLVQFSLLAAQVLFGLAAIAWLILAVRDQERPKMPAFALPLGLYAVWTLLSAAASIDPAASFTDSKQLVLFLMVPIVARVARGTRAATTLNVILALGAAGALVGIVQFAMLGYDNLDKRPEGLLSHYMTYSGVLMLVTGAAAARLLFYPQQIIWPAIAVPALLVALAVTLTRNAWLGAGAAITMLLWLRRRVLVLALPILAVIALLAAPPSMRARAFSMFDTSEGSNRDRIQMVGIGARMVRDHPLFGVGPEMVQRVYGQYRPADAVRDYNPHLHNVPMQIAAERGLPALALFLWFVVVALRDLLRQVRTGRERALAAAGAAAVVAMLVAGFFEYNFGDSEVLMLFLGLITLPWAASLTPARASAPARTRDVSPVATP